MATAQQGTRDSNAWGSAPVEPVTPITRSELPTGSVTVDLDLRVADADPHFCELVGQERESVLGVPVGAFLRDDDLAVRVHSPTTGTSSPAPELVETQCERPDGEVMWMHLG